MKHACQVHGFLRAKTFFTNFIGSNHIKDLIDVYYCPDEE